MANIDRVGDTRKVTCPRCMGSGNDPMFKGIGDCTICYGKKVISEIYMPGVPREEVRVVDPISGGEKGSKLARFSLIPRDWLWALAEHYGKGAFKYADRNWEKGYKWSLTLDALDRHVNAWLMGEDNDNHKPDCPPDCKEHTGSSHLICAAWHLVALWWFHKHCKGTDDITPRSGQYQGSAIWVDVNDPRRNGTIGQALGLNNDQVRSR